MGLTGPSVQDPQVPYGAACGTSPTRDNVANGSGSRLLTKSSCCAHVSLTGDLDNGPSSSFSFLFLGVQFRVAKRTMTGDLGSAHRDETTALRFRIVSGSSRLDIPPAWWIGRVPLKWRERLPRRVPDPDEAIVIDNWPLDRIDSPRGGKFSNKGITRPSVCLETVADGPDKRLNAQDLDGLDAEVIFTDPYSPIFLRMVGSQDRANAEAMYAHPIFAGFWRGVREDEGYKAWVHAYNEFLAEDYCSYCPSRLIGIGVIPDTGVGDAIAEMKSCAHLGLRGVALHRFPSGRGYPSPEDDRFWEVATGIAMPVSFLPDRGRTTLRQGGAIFQYPMRQVETAARQDPVTSLPGFRGTHPIAPLQLAHAGVFDRFPQLRIYFAEWQPGWPPDPLSQVDESFEQKRYWSGRSRATEPMRHPPSFYLRAHCVWSFLNAPYVVSRREDIGVRNLVWGNGLARATGDWPHPVNVIQGCFSGVPNEERYRMLAGNVIDFFHLADSLGSSIPHESLTARSPGMTRVSTAFRGG
jgi:uncharacterized protein